MYNKETLKGGIGDAAEAGAMKEEGVSQTPLLPQDALVANDPVKKSGIGVATFTSCTWQAHLPLLLGHSCSTAPWVHELYTDIGNKNLPRIFMMTG